MARKATSELDAVRKTAAAWVVRLSDPACGEEARRAFMNWRDQALGHELAYERERLTWERLDRLQALRPAEAKPQPDLLLSTEMTSAPPSARNLQASFRWAVAACIVGLVAATIVALGPLGGPAYATAVGERRIILLPDHTRVELNTNTEIVVLYRGGRRRIRLVRGEAVIDVAHGAAPLMVLVGDAVLKATGAQMDVRVEGDSAAVIVSRGDAALERRGSAPLRISKAVEVSYEGGRANTHPISDDDLNRNLAWRQDGIDLTGRTLNQAVAEFNRYNTRQVLVMDPSISGIRLGGYFHNSDVDGFVRALTIAFPVTARNNGDQVVLSKRAAASPQATSL